MKINIKKSRLMVNKHYFYFIIVFIFIIIIQINAFSQNIIATPQYSRLQTQCFKDSIILNGDLESWFWLTCTKDKEYPKYSNGQNNRYELEFPYVLILANRYNDPQACYAIYDIITELYDAYNIEMDSGTIQFILFYLNKGASLGERGCLRKLYELYSEGKYIDKDMDKANEYKIQFDAITDGVCPYPK